MSMRPIRVTAPGSRIRLSSGVLQLLGLSPDQGDFQSVGYFRADGELLVYPSPGNNAPNNAGQTLLRGKDQGLEDTEGFGSVPPPARLLVAEQKVFEFSCTWTGQKNQLDLNIGKAAAIRLGLSGGKSFVVYPFIWGRVLILMSESANQRAWSFDITEELMELGEQ